MGSGDSWGLVAEVMDRNYATDGGRATLEKRPIPVISGGPPPPACHSGTMRQHRARNPFLRAYPWPDGFRVCAFRAKLLRNFVASAHPGMTERGAFLRPDGFPDVQLHIVARSFPSRPRMTTESYPHHFPRRDHPFVVPGRDRPFVIPGRCASIGPGIH